MIGAKLIAGEHDRGVLVAIVWIDADVALRGRRPKRGLPYSAFPWELPRKKLKAFPLLLEHDRRGRFVGVTIFRPRRSPATRRTR